MPECTMLIDIFPCLWTEGQIFSSDYVSESRWGGNTFWIETSLLKISHIFFSFFFKKYGTLHEFACHPCAGAMLIFSVSFQF